MLSSVRAAQPIQRSGDLEAYRMNGGRWVTARARGTDAVLVMIPTRGTMVVSRDESLHRLRPGEALLLRGDRTTGIVVDAPGTGVVIRIDTLAIGPAGDALRAALGRTLTVSGGAPGLVASFLVGLAQAERSLTTHPERLTRQVIGLVGLMCAEAAGCPPASSDPLLTRIKAYIEEQLSDPELCPDSIAVAHNVSTRTLHRLFENEGSTIAGWIRARRLESCRQDLSDPDLDGLPVSAVGARWGLCDAAHFSRLFKSAYGRSPREFRAKASLANLLLTTA